MKRRLLFVLEGLLYVAGGAVLLYAAYRAYRYYRLVQSRKGGGTSEGTYAGANADPRNIGSIGNGPMGWALTGPKVQI